MIRFEGELSTQCKKHIKKNEFKGKVLVGLFMMFVSVPIFIVIAYLVDWIFLLMLLLPVMVFLVGISPQKIDDILPKEIQIVNEEIWYRSDRGERFNPLNQIKKVIDMGDCYVFDFFFPHKYLYCACQKDLLKEGSIDEFEALFQDKLVRKTKK